VPALHLTFRGPAVQPGEPNNFRPPILQKHTFNSQENVRVNIHSDSSGVYEITGVPQGRYTVRFRDPSSGQLMESTNLDITRDGQELNESGGEPLGSLKVTVKMPGEEALPKQYGVGLQDSQRKFVAFRPGDAAGQATFEDLAAGKYTIYFGAPERRYGVISTLSAAGVSSGNDVTIAPGAAVELTAQLTVGMVRIEGAVQKKGKPVAGVMVALVPENPQAHLDYFRRDQSDFDGTFLLQGVFPGSYTIVAVEDAWGFDWLQPGVLARYAQHGQNVNVGELMRRTVRLPEAVEVQPR
jgi:hypothetical protein